MRSLLICAAAAMAALAVGCSDVRVVDDDDGDGNSGAGPTGGGGAPSTAPVNARLFAAGWDGVHIWDAPEEGIARDADVLLPIEGVLDLAIVGDRLCVLVDDDLWVYDGVWELGTGAQPTVVIDKNEFGQHPMRAIPGLDAVWADERLYTGVSAIESGADPIQVSWYEPIYDVAADRLFVVVDFTIQVIENASQSTSFEPDWTLYDGVPSVGRLTTDGALLFGSRSGSGGANGWRVATWPLSAAEPTLPDGLDEGPLAEIPRWATRSTSRRPRAHAPSLSSSATRFNAASAM